MCLSLMMTSGCGLSRPLPPDNHCALNVSTHAAPSLQASYWRNYQDQVHIDDIYAKNTNTNMNTIADKDQLGPLTTSMYQVPRPSTYIKITTFCMYI